jgi:hypothetical protein
MPAHLSPFPLSPLSSSQHIPPAVENTVPRPFPPPLLSRVRIPMRVIILTPLTMLDSPNALLLVRRQTLPAKLLLAPRTYTHVTSTSFDTASRALTRHMIAPPTLLNRPLAPGTLLRRLEYEFPTRVFFSFLQSLVRATTSHAVSTHTLQLTSFSDSGLTDTRTRHTSRPDATPRRAQRSGSACTSCTETAARRAHALARPCSPWRCTACSWGSRRTAPPW